ncbi:MAG: hypothetical protein PW789_05645 [Edaphobacter sp.]|uniref:hypothetical protein n=1 Tax=Edaphobacter sp. TaxID=1934404 RepID=UPI0023A3DCD7|nr:hypothetical protein [Edaphobacter sp.]MDE1176074.1 hypothetical protein [Edaphobacter sp.]
MKENQPQAIAATWPRSVLFATLLFISLMIRIAALLPVAGAPLASDSGDYREMAVQLLSRTHFVPYWPPGMSLYLAPFVAAGAGTMVLRASMLLWWVLFFVGFARLAKDLKIPEGLRLAVLAIFSVTPALIHFSIEPMTQMPAAALLVWALSATVRCVDGAGWGEALLLGGSLGYFSLVRPSALPLAVVLPVVVLLRRRSLSRPLAAVAVAAVMVAAWAVYAHQLCGRWMINNSNGANAYYGNNPWTPLYRTWYFGSHAKLGSDEILQYPEYESVLRSMTAVPEIDRGAAYQKLATAYVLRHPGVFLLRTANRIRCFWGFDIFTAANLRGSGGSGRRWFPVAFVLDAVCYLAIAGFAFFWIAAAPATLWRSWQAWLLTGAIVLYGLPYWVTMSHPTYHFPVLAPLAVLGLVAYRESGSRASRGRGWCAVLVLALIQVEWMFFLTKN